MEAQNIELFEAFKQLDRLCKEIYAQDKGVTAYIEDMQRQNDGWQVAGWQRDLERLKEVRHLRNQLAHDPYAFQEDLCAPADVQYVKEFYQRILSGRDPLTQLATLRRARQNASRAAQAAPKKTVVRPAAVSSRPSAAPQKQGCYLATCVYGSYDCPPVWVLRRFRDEKLAASRGGRQLIRAYYAVSPVLVRYCGGMPLVRRLWQACLDPLVRRLHRDGYSAGRYQD